jgi:hypothetical protein
LFNSDIGTICKLEFNQGGENSLMSHKHQESYP